MSIGLIALIIAICSFIWNVISSLHSWRASMPAVEIRLRGVWPNIEVTILNRGGSPVLISQVSIIVVYRRHGVKRSGTFPIYIPDSRGNSAALKTSLPFTVQGYHNHQLR